MVELRGGGRDMVAVTVYAPRYSRGQYAELAACPGGRRAGRSEAREVTCEELEDGTSVMVQLVPSGFSDDNEDGVVVSGASGRPDRGAALVMYESYDPTPAVSPDEVAALLGDPRMAWRADPALERAGRALAVGRLRG